jgi:hypothetical protein
VGGGPPRARRVDARAGALLDALGITDLIVGALAGNEDALRLYRRRGYRPTWLYLSRWQGR